MKRKILLCFLLFLSACTRVGESQSERVEEAKEQKNYIVVCSSEQNDETTFFAIDDEIHSMQKTFFMTYEEAEIMEDMSEEEIKDSINSRLSDKYSSIAGVSAIVDEVVDNRIKIIFMIDFEQADMDQLVDAGLIEKGEVQSQYVSLKKTRENYVENGFACEIQ